VHKLVVLTSGPMVDELVRRLEDASIAASIASERSAAEVYTGMTPSVSVFIASDDDLERAVEILRDVQAQQTRVRCPQCLYDLHGHTGRTTCPECAYDLSAPAPDVECPACGEAVPPSFEVCWSCGASLTRA